MLLFSIRFFFLLSYFQLACAATAEQWRSRSIYQLITDRFALPDGADRNACDPGQQTFCGGNWNTIRENLDYIQNAGFTAIWISPINQNYEGPRTPYGDPYHGYWMQDISKLNDRFGTADDLKALIKELHRRDMYIMVDVVVNNVMATSTNPDYSKYFFKDASMYHSYCPVQWGNTTSEQACWLGDKNVSLPDVDTTNPAVIVKYGTWIQDLVQEYDIDGLRLDAAKHVQMAFWPQFCGKAGVFCMGEVFGGVEVDPIAQFQGPQALDSVLNFPMYSALMEAFAIPGPKNITALQTVLADSKAKFKDTGLLGNFLENQDVPRWHNKSVDPQSLYNAMVLNWFTDGIPIVYYGQEQSFSGATDPYNREPLWISGYQETDAYKFIKRLNQVRNFLVKTDWLQQDSRVLATSSLGIVVMRGQVITVATNIGSPPQNGSHIAVPSPYESSTEMINVLTCQQWVVGSKGFLDVEYTKGGVPVILIPADSLKDSGLCGKPLTQNGEDAGRQAGAAVHPFVPMRLLLFATSALLHYLF